MGTLCRRLKEMKWEGAEVQKADVTLRSETGAKGKASQIIADKLNLKSNGNCFRID